jgi:N-formylglutamate amidohydrolase
MKPSTDPIIINSSPTIPVVAHIPHSSSFIPEHVLYQFMVSEDELYAENRKLVDWFTDDLYAPVAERGGTLLRYMVSRFVCDPERFEDDSQECMAQQGMGVVYTHGTAKQRIRREITRREREALLQEFYRPYHKVLTEQVAHVVKTFGRCTLIDCHSYQEKALPYELDGDASRADVVFGDDPIHTPGWVRDEVQRIVTGAGYTFGLNRPFAGTVVPLSMYGDTRVTSFMLEINRATYMNEETTTRNSGFDRMRELVREVVEVVVGDTATSHIGA